MRILLDTNVLFSALLFPSKRMDIILTVVSMQHTLVMPSYVADELKDVVKRKFPAKESVVDELLSQMSFELVYTPQHLDPGLFSIRDRKDYPVLYTAIMESVDVLVTGDKDFSGIDIEKPEILTPSEFLEKYC